MHSFEPLWRDGPRFCAGDNGICTDSVLLADFAGGGTGRACDLGSGSGILSVLLAVKHPKLAVDAVELQPEAAELCGLNLEAAGISGRCRALCADLRRYRELWRPGEYDVVISNPPYFPTDSGGVSPDPARATARSEASCTLSELCAAAAYLLKNGGRFALVHRPSRLSELFCAMSAAGIEPKRLRLVLHAPGTAPSLVLVEGRRGGRPGLNFEPELLLHGTDGADSPEARRIYHID